MEGTILYVHNVSPEFLLVFCPKYFHQKLDYMSAAIFDNRLHICLTCHERVSKGKIPFQEVCHQLEVEVSPKILQDLRRLEKGLISRGILFKKKVMMFS